MALYVGIPDTHTDPLQTREYTHEMGLTPMFKLANYLMRKEDAFDVVVADIRDQKTLHETGRLTPLLEECGTETLLKHPETLVIWMNRYLGEDVTWTILAGTLQTHMPDFNMTSVHARGQTRLEKYDMRNNSKIEKVILDALFGLREADLERVKLLLLWDIVTEYSYIPLGSVVNSSPCRLTQQIFSKYADHAACLVMTLIFTQMQRPDLVGELTAAAAYSSPLQTNEGTHMVGPTRIFKMVNYLMRTKAAFATVVANIRAHKALPPDSIDQLALMFKECGADTLLKYPETLVHGTYCYLGHDVTWNIVLGILKLHMPEFSVTHLSAHGLERLERLDRCNNSKIDKVILDALSNLREGDLERVKLMLSWEIVTNYGHIPLARVESSSPRRLTEQIFSRYSDHTAYVMTLIFTQIQRLDMVEKLTAAVEAKRRNADV